MLGAVSTQGTSVCVLELMVGGKGEWTARLFARERGFSTSMVSSSSLSEELYSGWARFMLAERGIWGRVGAAGREEFTEAAPLRAPLLAFRTHWSGSRSASG